MKKNYIYLSLIIVLATVLFLYFSTFLPQSIKKYAEGEIKAGRAINISVFIQSLNSSKTFGFAENDAFIPASLEKVPYMMSILKQAEKKPTLLHANILYTEEMANQYKDYPNYPPVQEKMKVGTRYTVEDLLSRMIKYSDNDALATLLRYFLPNRDVQTLAQINQNEIKKKGESEYLSPKTYAKIFLVLYQQRYLNPSMSQKALSLLTNTTFTQGIQAGLPPDVSFAHKYGVNVAPDTKGLNECGIVFAQNPYIICIMTNGRNFSDLQEILKTISAKAYKNFSG